MKTAQKTVALAIAAASLAVVSISGSTGCATPQESTGSSSADLLTPIPLFHSIASEDTAKALNIHEWRIYKGKHEYTVTGYDATGHAVSGFAIGAYGHTASTKSHLRARMLDGSKAVIRPVFGGSSLSTGALSTKSSAFIDRAMSDFAAIKSDLSTQLSSQSLSFGGSNGTGLHTLGNPTSTSNASTQCATALMSMLTDSMTCGAAMSKTPGATAASIPSCMKSVTDIASVELACSAATASAGGKSSDAGAGGGSSGGSKGSGGGESGGKGSGGGSGGGKDSGGGGGGGGKDAGASTPSNNGGMDASPNTPANNGQDAAPNSDPASSDAGPDPDQDPTDTDASTDPNSDPSSDSDGGADDPSQCTDDQTCASQTDSDGTDQTCESCPEGSTDSADTSDNSDNGDVDMGEDSGDDDYADDGDDDDFDDSYSIHPRY